MLLGAHRIRANEEGEANDTVSALEEDLNRAVILDHSQVLPLRRVDVADYAHLLQVERRCQLISELKIDGLLECMVLPDIHKGKTRASLHTTIADACLKVMRPASMQNVLIFVFWNRK